jgi:molybdopterin-dependent oxidoreductase alpha subunit
MTAKRRRWVSLAPQGMGHQKPFHYGEMMRVAWENRAELPFAWRILRDGVCDGCALGTSGLHDWTIPGVHLCMVRLELLRLNTAPALDLRRLEDASALTRLSSSELRELGRLPEPLMRRRGDRGFRAIGWDDALELIAAKLRETDPQRMACYLTSRGITNEVYYVAQKAMRAIGSNHVDNSARLCHAASTAAMKTTLGHGASTCSYVDWLDADLIVFFGANTPNNQPVTTKYLHEATKRGARIAVVNTFREPGLQRYWVPSIASSAMFGTRLADEWFDVQTGGDLAFLIGVFKALVDAGGIDEAFVRERTRGFEAARDAARAADWNALAAESGASVDDMRRFAQLLIARPNTIFVWSMGLTQHAHGVDTVRALVNVGLARGLVGRPNRGLMPIRGHSGVQGGAEVGCVPNVDPATRANWTNAWGFEPPAHHGLTAAEMVDASARGDVDLWWQVGGNFLETLADESHSRTALARPALRIHQDIVMSSAMLVDPAETVIVLPAATRYESPGGGTETSTERRIIFSPEISGRRIGSARAEWEVFRDVVARAFPDRARFVAFPDAASIRADIARAVPLYAGIERLAAKGDQFQWGGRSLFANEPFATADGFAHFTVVSPLGRVPARDRFFVSTRRGKQFNSMVQRDIDPLTGAARDAVLISADDAARLGVTHGAAIELRSPHGVFAGRAHIAPMRAGNLEVHWPEGNVLLSGVRRDPASLEPDYNIEVTVELPALLPRHSG